MTVTTYPLLGDLSEVPSDYQRVVAETKRFLERYTMDPAWAQKYHADPDHELAAIGLSLTREQTLPLVDGDEARRITLALQAGEDPGCPDSVIQYRAFIAEKHAHRAATRVKGQFADPKLAAWRRRQVRRNQMELGGHRADAIVHAPVAIELSKGCTVGCWFCGVAAPKFDHNWHYDAESRELWRGMLHVLLDLLGPGAAQGFLYWASDPLDNPDYEQFVVDFHDILGRCPQTTTANGPKNIERTRALLELTHSLGSAVDRFSIIALNHLYRLHESLTAEEMLRIECVPQNKESAPRALKSNAGRARDFRAKKASQIVDDQRSSTIACVSGFLFNMVDKRVQLITPCNASDKWPLGYWVVDEGTFETADELRELMSAIIDRSCRLRLERDDVVSLRPMLHATGADGALQISHRGVTVSFGGQDDAEHLAGLLNDGTRTMQDIALERLHHAGVPLAWTYSILNELFDRGVLDEEPEVSAGYQPAPRRQPVEISAR